MAESNEISADVSARICSHMNDGHSSSVHAMAIASQKSDVTSNYNNNWTSIKNAQMTSVSLKSYKMSYVKCDGDMCSTEENEVLFDAVLLKPAGVKPQLIAEHHKALTPKLSWMVTDQDNFTVSSFLALGLMYCALTSAAIEPILPDDMISMLIFLGKDTNTKLYVERLVIFIILCHFLEGFFVVYLCKSKLKVGNLATGKWFLLVLATGFYTTKTLWFLVRLDKPKIKEDAKEK